MASEINKGIKHPARYSKGFHKIFYDIILYHRCKNIIDVMAGSGSIGKIRDYGYSGAISCNEIEMDFCDIKYDINMWTFVDAESLPYPDAYFDCICTSPTYGNRMADKIIGKGRRTYSSALSRIVKEENTGGMQWGEKYREKHKRIYKECYRILEVEGIFILNMSNHIRKGIEVDVCSFHKKCLLELGFYLVDIIKVNTNRYRLGSNSEKRVDGEFIFVFKKPTK